jgi:hypothetical protein
LSMRIILFTSDFGYLKKLQNFILLYTICDEFVISLI